MDGLALLGAADALATQYVTLHIKSVDAAKLRSALSGSQGEFAAAGLHFVNAAPQAALDIAIPFVKGAMKDYGIDADITVTNAPPAKTGRALSEFWPGLAIGTVAGASTFVILKGIANLFTLAFGRR